MWWDFACCVYMLRIICLEGGIELRGVKEPQSEPFHVVEWHQKSTRSMPESKRKCPPAPRKIGNRGPLETAMPYLCFCIVRPYFRTGSRFGCAIRIIAIR